MVRPASRVRPGEKMPSVPTLAAFRPRLAQMWRTKWTVEDLAVGAGHGRDRRRLRAGEGGRHQRHAAARIGVADDDDRGIEWRQVGVGRGQDRDRAALHRLGNEGRAVLPVAGEGGEKKAGPDLARVESQAGKDGVAAPSPTLPHLMGEVARRAGGGGACPHEVTQQQRDALPFGVRPRPGSGRAVPAEPYAVPGRHDGGRSPARTAAAAPAPARGVEAISIGGRPCFRSPGRMP